MQQNRPGLVIDVIQGNSFTMSLQRWAGSPGPAPHHHVPSARLAARLAVGNWEGLHTRDAASRRAGTLWHHCCMSGLCSWDCTPGVKGAINPHGLTASRLGRTLDAAASAERMTSRSDLLAQAPCAAPTAAAAAAAACWSPQCTAGSPKCRKACMLATKAAGPSWLTGPCLSTQSVPRL